MPILEKLQRYNTTQVTPLPEYYEPTDISVIHKGQQLSLTDSLDHFLSSSQRVLLVKGQALAGKTSLCHWVNTRLLQSSEVGCRIPVYIALSESQNINSIIIDALIKRGLTTDEIIDSKSLPLVFILDGYEDLGESKNLYISNQLSQWPHAKTIVTCRSQYFIYQNSQYIFTPFYGENAHPNLLMTIDLQPLDKESIHEHIKKYAAHHHITLNINAVNYITTWLEQKHFLRHTLLSELFLKSFMDVIRHGDQLTDLNNAVIQAFTLSWQQYHQEKNASLPIGHETPPYMNYHAAVARELKTYDGQFPLIKLRPNLFTRQQQTPQNAIFNLETRDVRLAFMHAPLHVDGQYLTFLDSDLLTYFSGHEAPAITTALQPASTTTMTVSDNMTTRLPVQTTLENDNLNLTSYTEQDDITALLADSILVGDKNSEYQRKRLFQFVIRSKNNPHLATGSANALGALVMAGESLAHLDLRHINAPKANLSHMIAQGTLFEHADLSGSRLVGAYLAGSQFQHANMSNITWGELGLFYWTSGCVFGLSFVDDNKKLMVWGDNNTVALFYTDFNNPENGISVKGVHVNPISSYFSHTRRVFSAILSTNNEYLVSTGRDKTIRLLNLRTEKQTTIIDLAEGDSIDFTYPQSFPIVFTPDESAIIYAREKFSGSYKLYQQPLDDLDISLKIHFKLKISGIGHVTQLVYLNSATLAIVTADGHNRANILIYNLHDNMLIKEFLGYYLCLSQQYQQIAIASLTKDYNNIITFYQLNNFNPLHTIENSHATAMHSTSHSNQTIRMLQYIPNQANALLCSAGDDGCILFWNPNANQQTPILSLHPHTMPITAISFSSDGKTLATASGTINLIGHNTGDRYIRIFDVETLLSQAKLHLSHQGDPIDIVIAHKRGIVYSAGRDGFIHSWSLTHGENLRLALDTSLYHPDKDSKEIRGLYLLTDHADYTEFVVLLLRSIRVFRVTHEVTHQQEMVHDKAPELSGNGFSMAFSEDKQRYVNMHLNAGVVAYHIDGTLLFIYRQADTVRASFSPDNGELLALLHGSQVSIIDGHTGTYQYTINGITGEHYSIDSKSASHTKHAAIGLGSLAFSKANPRHLAFVFNHYKNDYEYQAHIVLWDIETKTCLAQTQGNKAYVNTLCFSPSGQYLLICDDDGCMMLWDIQLQQKITEQFSYSHGIRIQSVKFIDDSQFVIIQGDGSLKSWRIHQASDTLSLRLLWSTSHELIADKAVFENTEGLSSNDRWLLKSHDAIFSSNHEDTAHLLKMARICYQDNRFDLALRACSLAIDIDYRCAEAYLLRGRCYKQLNNTKEAEEDFTRCISFGDPAMRKEGYCERGLLFQQVNMPGQAKKDLDLAKKIQVPNSAHITAKIERTLSKAEEGKRVEDLFDACINGSDYRFTTHFKADDITKKNSEGLTLLHIAAHQNHMRIVTRLLEKGADPCISEDKFGNTALAQAIASENGSVPLYEALIKQNSKVVNKQNNKGWSPLHTAVSMRLHDVAALLLKHGANPNARRIGAVPVPLCGAIKNQDVAMVKLLLDNHADYTIASSFGSTPFDLVCDELDTYENSPGKRALLCQIGTLFIQKAEQEGIKLRSSSLALFARYQPATMGSSSAGHSISPLSSSSSNMTYPSLSTGSSDDEDTESLTRDLLMRLLFSRR